MRGRGKGMDIETLQKPVPLVRGRGFGGYGYGYGLLYPGVTPAHHYGYQSVSMPGHLQALVMAHNHYQYAPAAPPVLVQTVFDMTELHW